MELTKGKWKASRSASGDWKVDTDDALIAKEIRECNVYAIAAVPELVAACEAIQGSLASIREYDAAMLKLRNALAKARGEQQDEEA